MEEQFIKIHGATIEIGGIDFTVFTGDETGGYTPEFNSGDKIKFNTREDLIKMSELYVREEELPVYLRYVFNRIERLASNQFVPDRVKAELFYRMGKDLVDRIYENPQEVQNIQSFGRFIKSYIDLMLYSSKAANYLLEYAADSRYPVSHGFNVATVCMLIGKRMFGNARIKLWELGVGGLLVDIGMSRISEDIVNKSGKLSESEIMIMRQHTFIGRKIIERLDLDKTICDMIYYHHERYDGSGYPKGLKGNEIPLYARIAAVADVYDAITTDRVYKKGMNYIEALSLIYKERKKYDPKVLDALLRVVLKSEKLINNFKSRHEKDD